MITVLSIAADPKVLGLGWSGGGVTERTIARRTTASPSWTIKNCDGSHRPLPRKSARQPCWIHLFGREVVTLERGRLHVEDPRHWYRSERRQAGDVAMCNSTALDKGKVLAMSAGSVS